jgi:VanZ family protein
MSEFIREKIKEILKHKQFQKYEKYISWALWLLVIFVLSSQSLSFLEPFNIWEYILRKIFHMFEFAVVAYLTFRILSSEERKHFYWNLFWTFSFSVLYAISDEYHQIFTFGRTGTYRDVLIDSLGALFTIWLLYINHRHKEILRNK